MAYPSHHASKQDSLGKGQETHILPASCTTDDFPLLRTSANLPPVLDQFPAADPPFSLPMIDETFLSSAIYLFISVESIPLCNLVAYPGAQAPSTAARPPPRRPDRTSTSPTSGSY